MGPEVAIRLHIEPVEDGGFAAMSPDVPSFVAENRPVVEATDVAIGMARGIFDSSADHGNTAASKLLTLAGGVQV